MTAHLSRLILTFGAGLIFIGCPSAQIITHRISDEVRNEIIVESSVKGLSHVWQDCRIEAATYKFRGQSAVYMDPAAAEPQPVETTIREWTKTSDPTETSLPSGRIRLRFYFRNHLFDEKLVEFPHPEFDPLDPLVSERRDPEPRHTDPGPSASSLPPLPSPISQKVERATRAEVGDGLRAAKPLKLGIKSSTSPQFALIDTTPGPVRIDIKVNSHGKSAGTTYCIVELLDKSGGSLPEPLIHSEYFDAGESFRTSVVWEFDGKPKVLKIESGTKEGDEVTITLEREE